MCTRPMGSVAVVPVPGRATGRPVMTVGTLLVAGSLTPLKGAETGRVTVVCGASGTGAGGITIGGGVVATAAVLP